MVGSVIITTATFVTAMVLMYLVKATKLLRVSREGELYGLDLHEHGISAYPEYVITALGSPTGMAGQQATVPAQAMQFSTVLPEGTR
jgi:Amt family ammonium transporter